MGALYCITFPNGKQYVGITSQAVELRWQQHRQAAARGVDTLLYRAMRKHGMPQIQKLAEYDCWDSLCIVERRAISAFNTMIPHGYNMTSGGEGVPDLPRTAEHYAKVSAALKGKRQAPEVLARMAHTQRARLADPTVRANLSAKLTGKRHTQETRQKMSEAQRGRKVSAHTRHALSAALQGRKRPPEHVAAMRAGRQRAKNFRQWAQVVHLATVQAFSEAAEFSSLEKPRGAA